MPNKFSGAILAGANNSMILRLMVAAVLVANCLQLSFFGALPASGQSTANGRLAEQSRSRQQYFGAYIGRLNARRDHNISGDVFAVDEQTLFIRRFNYDGLAPDAYFWSSVVTPLPSGPDGFIVPDEKGSTKPLERYSSKDVVLRLPEGKTLREINWLSVWSRQRKENLADIFIEKSLVMPRPLEIGPLTASSPAPSNTHGVRSGPITIVDAQTFLVPDLHYDGLAPDAYFWLTSGGAGLGPAGSLKLKDENGSQQPLRKYSGETVVISLPDELTIYDFDYFGLWCREFSVSFGQVRIPQQARVPPSPKMLGIKPENKLNCEILYDDLGYEIRWVLDGDDIVMQLVGKIEPSEYMAFGLGKDDSRSEMSNADAVVAWVERQSGQVHAVDYFLGGKQQCGEAEMASAQASCPDARLQGGGDSLTLLHGAIVNGYSMVTFKRPQLGVDELYDQHVYSDGQQSVMWAIGQLNARKEVGYHRLRARGNMFIDFARNPQWNCPIPDLNASMQTNLPVSASASQLDPTFASSSPPSSARQRPEPLDTPTREAGGSDQPQQQASGWFVPSIVCPQDKTFHAQIGPTGGPKRGYESITGRPSWGVAWYINGLMIPELVVERGQSYRFIVEGGNDKTSAPRRHPLYLTDSLEGGFHFKTDEERTKERIFAGVALRGDGQFVPMAEGRMCEWRHTNQTLANPDSYQTFSAYQRSLKLECQPGGAAVLKFSPDPSTPDLLYYQCYTHRFMGWRIRVVDSCAAHLASHQSTPQRSSMLQPPPTTSSTTNNNNKRDLSVLQSARNEQQQLRTYSRRKSFDENPVAAAAAANGDLLFADPSGQLDGISELALESDLMILNNSQLHQKQPYNLSNFDEILRLSPADLEFLDQQDQQQFANSFGGQSANQNQNQPPPGQLALQLALLNQIIDPAQHNQQQPNKQQLPLSASTTANKTTTTRIPKTLQSYMRRLASIYYPVQQQLASMLSTQNGSSVAAANNPQTADRHHQQQPQLQLQPMTSESAPSGSTSASGGSSPMTNNHNNNNGFSLASLMPKPKIDLSKSTLSRKFNKLRFKSGRKLEPTGQQALPGGGPPRPANEFNYDIFNNQLAQLEKQQKQLQSSFDFGWQQQPSESFHQQQSLFPVLAHTNGGFLMEPITAEQLNFQSSILNNNMFASQQQQQQRPKTQLAGNVYQAQAHAQKQPARLELTFSFNNRTSRPQLQQPQWAPFNQPSGQSDEHAIFITRLPQPLAYAPQYPMPASWQQQQPSVGSGQVSMRYPSIQPHGGSMIQLQPQQQQQEKRRPFGVATYADSPQQEQGGQLSGMPSVALTVHSDSTRSSWPQLTGNEIPTAAGENLSDSSGSAHQFTQPQPQPQPQQQRPSDQVKQLMQSTESTDSSNDSDHMLAIERFSKLPSERRPPSVVHPVTGERVLYVDRTQQPSSNNQTSSDRLSNLFSVLDHGPEIMDTEQSIQYQSNDLQRLNSSTGSAIQAAATAAGKQKSADAMNRLAATTVEPLQPFLGRPAVQQETFASQQRDKFDQSTSTTTTTTMPSIQVSPPSIMTASSQQEFSQPSYPTTTASQSQAQTSTPLKSNLVEPIRSTLVQNDLTPATGGDGGGFINAFNAPRISQLNFDSSPFTPIELNPFYQPPQPPSPMMMMSSQQQQPLLRLRPPSLIESMYHSQDRPEPPVQVASYLSQQLAGYNPLMYMTSEKSLTSNNPISLSSAQSAGTNQSPLARQSTATNELIILKPSTMTKDNTYILKPEYITTTSNINLPRPFSHDFQQSAGSIEDPYSVNSISDPQNEASRKLVGIQFDRLSSLSSPPSTSIALDPLQTSHSVSSYNIEQVDSKSSTATREKELTTTKSNSSDTNNKNSSQHRQTSIQIPLTSVLEPVLMGSTSSNTPEGVRTNPGGPSSSILPRDNQTDNAILSHVMSLISSNAIPTPPLIPVASYSNADYFLPSSDRIYRSIRG